MVGVLGNSTKMLGSSDIRGKKKAQCDAITVKIFCEECVRQICAGQRQGKTLTRLAWKDVQVKFNHRAKRNYEHKQLKNKWDGLRAEWLAWKSIMSETGLGFNHEKGTVEALEDWWDAKIKMNRLYQNFKDAGLQNPTEMEIMFSTTVATGETAYTPAAKFQYLDFKRDTADQVMDMTRDVTMANQVMAATIRKMVLLMRNTR